MRVRRLLTEPHRPFVRLQDHTTLSEEMRRVVSSVATAPLAAVIVEVCIVFLSTLCRSDETTAKICTDPLLSVQF